MKLKCRPEDFRVEELTARVADGGPYALYRLTKRGLATPDALHAIARRWRIPLEQMSCGGLKDRHALTVQQVSIVAGPRRNLKQTSLDLVYLGQASRPFTSQDIEGNRFRIVLRDLDEDAGNVAVRGLESAARDGLPNYFDEQRFGSVGSSGDYVARAWCTGDYERALWLILADPNAHDRPDQRRQRGLVQRHWGDWARVRAGLARSAWRNVIAHLVDRPRDFRGAITRVPQDLRSIYLAAFQSAVWNRMLAELLRQRLPGDRLLEMAVAGQSLPVPCALDEAEREVLRPIELPLPSARMRSQSGPWEVLIQRALAPWGLALRELRVKYPRDSFFSKGLRRAMFFATGLEHQVEDDDLYGGRRKITLTFDLPRGAYATILTRRLALRR